MEELHVACTEWRQVFDRHILWFVIPLHCHHDGQFRELSSLHSPTLCLFYANISQRTPIPPSCPHSIDLLGSVSYNNIDTITFLPPSLFPWWLYTREILYLWDRHPFISFWLEDRKKRRNEHYPSLKGRVCYELYEIKTILKTLVGSWPNDLSGSSVFGVAGFNSCMNRYYNNQSIDCKPYGVAFQVQ